MQLRYNPYRIFSGSKTPAGLYARQKWLLESDTPAWRQDYQETVQGLMAGQDAAGSWNRSPMTTLSRLFGLHLTVRQAAAEIDAAINWLLGRILLKEDRIKVVCDDEADNDLRGLPFTKGRRDMLIPAATLFLASIFGRQNHLKVAALYRRLSRDGEKNNGLWFDSASSHNVTRAMVVHAEFAESRATELAVMRLKRLQKASGDWGTSIPFYQTVNALAHLKSPQAETQLEKAFARLFETQKDDGTWSRSEPEWNTFLTIHALKNKGRL